jgi:hypothetical protein
MDYKTMTKGELALQIVGSIVVAASVIILAIGLCLHW